MWNRSPHSVLTTLRGRDALPDGDDWTLGQRLVEAYFHDETPHTWTAEWTLTECSCHNYSLGFGLNVTVVGSRFGSSPVKWCTTF